MTNKEIEKFLVELKKVSLKYDIWIGGCGCCGSPYLYSKEDKEDVFYIVEMKDENDWYENLSLVTKEKFGKEYDTEDYIIGQSL